MALEQYIANPYLRALAVLVLVFVALRLVVWIIEKIVLRATSKTQTDVDDKFVKKISRPISTLILLLGVMFAVRELALKEDITMVFDRVLYSLIILSVAYIIYHFIDIVLIVALKKGLRGGNKAVRDSLLSLSQSVLKVVLVVLALLYVLDTWGIQIGPFLAGLGIAGIAIAFALQESLSNIFGGVSIILDQSVKVGDLVYLDADTKGKIAHIGLRSTKINTFDNELIIVPNSLLANSKIQNIGEPEPKTRTVIPFGVAYGADIENVKKIVMKEIKSVKHFINDPEPVVRFLEMADSSLNFKAYFYVESFENRAGAIDEANTKIYNALNKAGIEIPFPQMDINLKK